MTKRAPAPGPVVRDPRPGERCERRIAGGGPGDTCFRAATVVRPSQGDPDGTAWCRWHDIWAQSERRRAVSAEGAA